MQGGFNFKKRVKHNYAPNVTPNEGGYTEWMASVKDTLSILRKRPWQVSIYNVPHKLRRLKDDAYTPHIVSIGPVHHHKHELLAMEEHKWRYMLDFLDRALPKNSSDGQYYGGGKLGMNQARGTNDQHKENNSTSTRGPVLDQVLEECGRVVSVLENEARACYAENINLDKHQLIETLLLDGCFILELFIKHAEEEMMMMSKHDHNKVTRQEVVVDPIFNSSWMAPILRHDLALLENQVPFIILHDLFNIIETSNNQVLPFSLNKYILLFFRLALNLSDKAVDRMSKSLDNRNHKHLLDMLHQVLKPMTPKKQPKHGLEMSWGFKRSATKLFKSGIQFQVGDDDTTFLNITFVDGIIKIPPLTIQKSTDSMFRNLIALEQCSIEKHHVTSYVLLMSSLIRSQKDAELLPWITSNHGEDVHIFFKSLLKEVVCKDFFYASLCEEVNEYQKFPLHWERVKIYCRLLSDEWSESVEDLKQNYCQSKWTFISFLAALFVILLTILQTVYAIRSYYPHKQ